jgi:hypothetical protein
MKRLDLGAQEVVWARRSELGQSWGIAAVDEAQDRIIFVYGANKSLTLTYLSAQPRKYFAKHSVAPSLIQ